MSEDVMLGKVRHIMNTMEVCCLNSNPTDFTAYGWVLARDYATKVDEAVDQKRATWQDIHTEIDTATLLSAQMENPRPAPKTQGTKVTTNKKKEFLCMTYNTCKTEGKCEYEENNPDKKCSRKHECSYCMKQKKQSYRHQAARCKAKAAAEAEDH